MVFASKGVEKLRRTVIKKRPGRPRSTTKSNNKFISCSRWRNMRPAAADIKAQLNESQHENFNCAEKTLEAGLMGRVAARKPLLSRQNRVKRLAWAKKCKHWTAAGWKNVLWTNPSLTF